MTFSPCALGRCDGSGFLVDDETRTAVPCGCRTQLVSRRRAGSLSAVIPKRYKEVGFDRNPVTAMPEPVLRPIRAYVRKIDENLDQGRGLWLFGEVGTGKTTLAMLVAKAALDAGRSVAIYSMPRLLNEIRRTYDDGSDSSYLALFDRLAAVDLLHIDDVGAERSSPWVLEQLYSIVNARYEAERSMTITTNLDLEPLAEQIGDRTVSRLKEMCEAIPIHGTDHRAALEHSA
ncbi:MAG TPA: ATP-binding protein [Solirubrobacteraceae bacterium]|nr:ATP-binding protein [Solirubrobacteraceae bacterium]